jgi:FtsP/CotA-like multicopper oxidase with cupredoxin domain
MASLKALIALAATGLTNLAWAKHVNFDLNLTWQKGAPDGNMRQMIFMNEQFPGPELRLDQGDDVEVGLLCQLSNCEGTLMFTNCV